MTELLYLLIIAVWVCLLFAAMSLYVWYVEKEKIRDNLDRYIPPWKILKQKTSRKALVHGWMDDLAPVGKRIRILTEDDELEELLTKAGYPFQMSVQRLHGAKVLGALGGFLIGLFWMTVGLPLDIFMLTFGPVLGYLSPKWIIQRTARKRQEQIRYELPDFLDMMSITLSAGMPLDEAISCYVDTADGPLCEELERLLQEIRFGVRRETAYRSLMKRTDSPDLEALIQSLIQAHNLGTPVARIVARQAEEMRRIRMERAKEAAGKAAPKISLVTGLFIAPSIMMLILAAVIYNYVLKNGLFGF
ncbi:type II secretion system F family protein [Staphylospora marina]|uniref:type II secretion system F family protein n=1 Tax=Staphylospora marina TaxID=2490858 RepID=UPI0013DE1D25|nr:type II secretion system F family protein [Staphylospora marina]